MVVGSGASGVHFALTLLRKGHQVIMLDVGKLPPKIVSPEDSFIDLKSGLDDPVDYFLGANYEAVIFPDFESEYYGFPPDKNYVFSKLDSLLLEASGFAPLMSFARGGLAEAWTGGVYPLSDQDLKQFPFSYADLEPYYAEVAKRIGISGQQDDLVRFYPLHDNLLPPLELDTHSEILLAQYQHHKNYLNNSLKCFLGRSRVATLSVDMQTRKRCGYTGRCLWGCPTESLYTPSITLNHCRKYPNFTYTPNMYVTHFNFNTNRRVTAVIAESLDTRQLCEFSCDSLALASGTLSSSKIFMDSIFKKTGDIIRLRGLMDNQQILVPFINLKMLGRKYNPDTYQYHQIAMGIQCDRYNEYIHGQITTLKTAQIHPIIQEMPLDLPTSILLFRYIHAALGILNINLQDTRRDENYLTVEATPDSLRSRLIIRYLPSPSEADRIRKSIKIAKKALLRLGCVVPPGMIHIRPMGASVHYAGTVPMSENKLGLTTSGLCQSHDFENLYFVDGTAFPSLPAKNLTFTLMANAVRVAENAF